MSEQYPLLCDELSEEEKFSPRFHRRLHMSRVRAKNQVKGAATIITRWPEHWTTLLNYWWIGIGMLAITTYVIYNFLFSYAMLQPTNKPIYIKESKLTPKPPLPPKVFMHIFVDNNQEVDLNNYLPYIDIITKKYKQHKYELIIVANDTNVETKNLSDKENNQIALDMLWDSDFSNKNLLTSDDNFNIKYITLSKYLQDSPIKNFWKSLPYQFIKFLVRAVSIWEKGGIAFDPIILTPQSPNSIYIDKVYSILKKYKNKKEKGITPAKSRKTNIPNKKFKKLKHKPNNIRDIIYALENEITTEKSYQEPLVEAETNDNLTVTFGRKLRSIENINISKETKPKPTTLTKPENVERNDSMLRHEDNLNKDTSKEQKIEGSSKLNLLPMFLDYLFYNKQTKPPVETTITTTTSEPKQEYNGTKNISKSNETKSLQTRDFWTGILDQMNYKRIVISAKGLLDQSDNGTKLAKEIEREVEHLFEVTIDLKGNIIATDTACHAFIGNMFTNAIFHDQNDSVTDFITKELSVFCKGLLTTCVGIDVIMV